MINPWWRPGGLNYLVLNANLGAVCSRMLTSVPGQRQLLFAKADASVPYPILMLLALWAVDTTVLMFRDPAAAAVLIAMVPVLVVLVARST